MNNFDKWDKLFRSGNLLDFTSNREALLWLKIKSFIRKDTVADYQQFDNVKLCEKTGAKQFRELFSLLSTNIEESHKKLNKYFEQENQKKLNEIDINTLVSDLYKVQSFEWGGDYNNSLDKYLVRNYVKAISSYDELITKLNNEVMGTVSKYVINSWYNNWTSILIEHIFKKHQYVLPTVGKVKSVDFFIKDVPFDLKVTYVPTGYVNEQRRKLQLGNEITNLKKQAKLANIAFDNDESDTVLYYSLTERMNDYVSSHQQNKDLFGEQDDKYVRICKNALEETKKSRNQIIDKIRYQPEDLMKWLYENQGEMRFGAENRIYIVLLNNEKWEESWKLKRNFELLDPVITNYLNNFNFNNVKKINFEFGGKAYETYSDIIFIINE